MLIILIFTMVHLQFGNKVLLPGYYLESDIQLISVPSYQMFLDKIFCIITDMDKRFISVYKESEKLYASQSSFN